MKSYLLLLRLNLKSFFNNFCGASIRKDNGKVDVSRIILYITAGIGMLILAGMVVVLETMLYRTAARYGLDRLLIGLALLLSMVTTLLFGVFHTLGSMYFNRDTAMMAYLPIPARTHMAARWTEIYLGEMLFSIALLLPMLINHGIAQGAGVLYYVGSAVTVLSTPLYPLAISLLMASLLGRLTSLTRNKEMWVVLGTIALLALVLGSEWLLLPQIPDDADARFFINLLLNNEALLNLVIGAFPPVMWAVKGMTRSWPMLALFAAVGLAAIAAVIYLMGGSYLRVCLKHTEQGTRKRSARRTKRDTFEPRSPFKAVFLREMNEVFKTPIYLMNAVMGVLMMPIMLIAMGVGASSADTGMTMDTLLDELLSMLSPTDLTLILAAMFSIMCFICPISSTAVSREGKRLPIMRMIPVEPGCILQAKLLVNFVIIAAGSVLMALAMVIFLGTACLPHVLGALVLANVLSYAVSIGNITVDVLRPVLEWKNETEVMKQNMNSMLGALVSAVMIAIAAVPPILMISLPAWSRMAAAVGIVLLETAAALIVLRKVTEPRFAALEP